jgi:hypothetical protein
MGETNPAKKISRITDRDEKSALCAIQELARDIGIDAPTVPTYPPADMWFFRDRLFGQMNNVFRTGGSKNTKASSPDATAVERFYERHILPRVCDFVRTNKEELLLPNGQFAEIGICEFGGTNLKVYFERWLADLVTYLGENLPVTTQGGAVSLIQYEPRTNLVLPHDKSERRTFVENTRLVDFTVQEISKVGIVENLISDARLWTEYQRLCIRERRLLLTVAVLGIACIFLLSVAIGWH